MEHNTGKINYAVLMPENVNKLGDTIYKLNKTTLGQPGSTHLLLELIDIKEDLMEGVGGFLEMLRDVLNNNKQLREELAELVYFASDTVATTYNDDHIEAIHNLNDIALEPLLEKYNFEVSESYANNIWKYAIMSTMEVL